MVHRLGFAIVLVENGAEAVDAVRTHSRFDCIFLDAHMPVLSGHEAAEQIRAELDREQYRERSPPPLVLLTAEACSSGCLRGVMDACLHKPLSLKTLQDFVTSRLPPA
jgi:CheY-like chemotaxis protein